MAHDESPQNNPNSIVHNISSDEPAADKNVASDEAAADKNVASNELSDDKNIDQESDSSAHSSVRSLSIKCTQTDGAESYMTIYVGSPKSDKIPIFFQIKALENKGYSVDQECVEYLSKIQDIAKNRKIPFLDLLDFALNSEGS